MTVWTILIGILMISVLALLHEIGHFFAAKASKIPVEEMSIGFGPTIFKKQSGNTVYKIGLLPILGYVKIKGMEGDFEAPDGFFKQNRFKRFMTLVMGPVMNFIAAIVLFSIVLTSFGNPFKPSTTVGSVAVGSPADVAGIIKGDKILEMNGYEIMSWEQVVDVTQKSEGNQIVVVVNRSGKELSFVVTPKKDATNSRWVMGIYSQGERYNILKSFIEGAKWTFTLLYRMFTSIPMLFTRSGLSSITGPIGIISMTGEAASGGFASLIWFMAFISIALGFTNLLPIPALDGSWIVIVIWEAITRKPVPPEKQASVQGFGFVVVLALMFLVSIRDILRILGK